MKVVQFQTTNKVKAKTPYGIGKYNYGQQNTANFKQDEATSHCASRPHGQYFYKCIIPPLKKIEG